MQETQIVIVGAGLVGLATAYAISQQYPDWRMTVLDKEAQVSQHQSGHNSGVLHAGLYYKPGSLKARLCLQGRELLEQFCEAEGVAYERCGKLVLATHLEQQPALMHLAHRALQNGLHVKLLAPAQLPEYEAHVRGVGGLWSPSTGIVDYVGVAQALRRTLEAAGVQFMLGAALTSCHQEGGQQVLQTTQGEVRTQWLIGCAGLQADQVARLCGAAPEVKIVPFRGEYFTLRPERRYLVKNLIYPVPDARFPFLGVHLTRRIGGGIEAGPNAVLALAREGYSRWTVRPAEVADTLRFGGFWKLAARYSTVGLYEMYRSACKREFARSLADLVPEVTIQDLQAGGSGVRAQALDASGNIVDDFVLQETPNALHVLNAPSPAATACLAIGRYVSQRASANFAWPAGVGL